MGHHVDEAGNLISCTYVDLRDPVDRSPITTLTKASSKRHARLIERGEEGSASGTSRETAPPGTSAGNDRRGALWPERLDLVRIHPAGVASGTHRLAGGDAAQLRHRLADPPAARVRAGAS